MKPLRLVTIPFSHYCEKARWALDRARVDYVEEPHPPIISWLATFGARGRRTTPVLVAGDEVLKESTDILRFADTDGTADRPLFPPGNTEVETLEHEFDEKLGPATRRLAYYYILAEPELTRTLFARGVAGWESRLASTGAPVIAGLIRRGLKIDEAGFERSLGVIERELSLVEQRLADGRRYLAGDAFSAADLTFAALATPLIVPEFYTRYTGDISALPTGMRRHVDEYRARPSGRFALRLYDEERMTLRKVA